MASMTLFPYNFDELRVQILGCIPRLSLSSLRLIQRLLHELSKLLLIRKVRVNLFQLFRLLNHIIATCFLVNLVNLIIPILWKLFSIVLHLYINRGRLRLHNIWVVSALNHIHIVDWAALGDPIQGLKVVIFLFTNYLRSLVLLGIYWPSLGLNKLIFCVFSTRWRDFSVETFRRLY